MREIGGFLNTQMSVTTPLATAMVRDLPNLQLCNFCGSRLFDRSRAKNPDSHDKTQKWQQVAAGSCCKQKTMGSPGGMGLGGQRDWPRGPESPAPPWRLTGSHLSISGEDRDFQEPFTKGMGGLPRCSAKNGTGHRAGSAKNEGSFHGLGRSLGTHQKWSRHIYKEERGLYSLLKSANKMNKLYFSMLFQQQGKKNLISWGLYIVKIITLSHLKWYRTQ